MLVPFVLMLGLLVGAGDALACPDLSTPALRAQFERFDQTIGMAFLVAGAASLKVSRLFWIVVAAIAYAWITAPRICVFDQAMIEAGHAEAYKWLLLVAAAVTAIAIVAHLARLVCRRSGNMTSRTDDRPS